MIRTRDLYVPNVALYQAEPHSDYETKRFDFAYFITFTKKIKYSFSNLFYKMYFYTRSYSGLERDENNATLRMIAPPISSRNVGVSPKKINA